MDPLLKNPQLVVVGAGLSGLQFSNSFGKDMPIIEKSRGILGRISSRRFNNSEFIKGAPKIDIKEESFSHFIKRFDGTQEYNFNDEERKFVLVTPQLRNGLKKHYSNQKVYNSKRVELIKKRKNSLSVIVRDLNNQESEVFDCRGIVLTGPLPQMIDLLPKNLEKSKIKKIEKVHYANKSVICAIDDNDIKNLKQNTGVSLLSDNPDGAVFVVNDQMALDQKIDSKERLVEFVAKSLSIDLIEVSSPRFHIHFWKYSNCINPLNDDFYSIDNEIFFIGDSFSNGGAQGAWLSANALANEIKKIFGEKND